MAPILIVAGEVSGDIHGGNLLGEISVLSPGTSAYGVGGESMARAGLECLASSESLAHMGVAEVVRELPSLHRIMVRVVREVEQRGAAAAVLIDSPDFNLRLARHLERLGIPVVLYISPQLWAWRRGRVRKIRRLAREVLCILPFEVDFYKRHGVPARYVGHPLVDDFDREGLLDGCPESSSSRLGLLPGSRAMEVRRLLPTMLRALRGLDSSEVDEAVLVEAPGMATEIDEVLSKHHQDPRIVRVSGSERRRRLASCGLAWTASGTATLECTLLGVPMIVGYRLHPATALVARTLVRIRQVALANLIAGRALVPQLLQQRWCPKQLIDETRRLNRSRREEQRKGLAEVRRLLGEPGASRRAAEAVLEHVARAPR